MTAIPWDRRASLWIGQEMYTTGTIAELAWLYRKDVPADRKWTAYLAGGGEGDLPVLHADDRPHMMQHGGLELLWQRYELEKPRG